MSEIKLYLESSGLFGADDITRIINEGITMDGAIILTNIVNKMSVYRDLTTMEMTRDELIKGTDVSNG